MRSNPRVIAFLVGSPCDLINLVSITSVFSYPKIGGKAVYSIKLLTWLSEHEVRGLGGVTLSGCIPYSEYAGVIDTLVVIGGQSAFVEPSQDLLHWIRKRAPKVRRLVGVCTGVFILAPTGLLDGKRITTHWHHAHRLAQQFPNLSIERDHIFVKDGNVYTTAGVTAGIDLALSIVEEDVGHAAVAKIAHTLILYIRRPGTETQYSTLLAQQADVSGTPMSDLPAWAESRLAQKLNVNVLAKVVAMTPRTFARQFETYFNTTPARWIQSLRVEAACSLIGSQNIPIKSIGKAVGFRDEQSMRRAFLQQLKITPKEYRETFGLSRTVDVT